MKDGVFKNKLQVTIKTWDIFTTTYIMPILKESQNNCNHKSGFHWCLDSIVVPTMSARRTARWIQKCCAALLK